MTNLHFLRSPDPEQGDFNQSEENHAASIESILAKLDEAAGLDEKFKKEEEKINKLKTTLQTLWNPYNEKRKAYENATFEYNDLRIKALSGSDSDAIRNFSVNGHILRSKVTTALNDWVNNGYKNDVETILAYIDQITKKKE